MSRLSIEDLERLTTWTPEIAHQLRQDVPRKPQPIRIGTAKIGRMD